MKVLIVEDNANLADVVRMGLSMEGMEAKSCLRWPGCPGGTEFRGVEHADT